MKSTTTKYNNFSSDSETNMTKLNEILKSRDPQTKAASSYLNPDPDTVSVQSGKESSLGRTMTKSRNFWTLLISNPFLISNSKNLIK